jgi:hypothetical protein
LAAGGIAQRLRRRTPVGLAVALVGAMVAGRAAYAAVAALLLGRGLAATVPGLVLAPWPGMLLQLALLPVAGTGLARFSGMRETPSRTSKPDEDHSELEELIDPTTGEGTPDRRTASEIAADEGSQGLTGGLQRDPRNPFAR